MLIKQNEDPEISDISIRKEMAAIHLALGEYDKGVELLKQNNPCRMNHPLIGQTLASSCNDPEDALPYLSMALLDLTVTHMEIVIGYINVFCKTRDYSNALALVDWALAFYPGLKNPEKRGYMDKNEAFLWAIRADIQLSLCNKEDAINSLRQAKNIASRFDEAPNYSASNIRFVSCQIHIGHKASGSFGTAGFCYILGYRKNERRITHVNLQRQLHNHFLILWRNAPLPRMPVKRICLAPL